MTDTYTAYRYRQIDRYLLYFTLPNFFTTLNYTTALDSISVYMYTYSLQVHILLIAIWAIYLQMIQNYKKQKKKLLEQIQVKDTITRPDDEVCMPHEAKRREQEERQKKNYYMGSLHLTYFTSLRRRRRWREKNSLILHKALFFLLYLFAVWCNLFFLYMSFIILQRFSQSRVDSVVELNCFSLTFRVLCLFFFVIFFLL